LPTQRLEGNRSAVPVLLAELDLADHDLVEARVYLTAAITTFRAGDHLTELAGAPTVAAGLARRAGDLDPAEHHAHEAGSVRSRPGRAHPRCPLSSGLARVDAHLPR
jgi:hypothetical protein